MERIIKQLENVKTEDILKSFEEIRANGIAQRKAHEVQQRPTTGYQLPSFRLSQESKEVAIMGLKMSLDYIGWLAVGTAKVAGVIGGTLLQASGMVLVAVFKGLFSLVDSALSRGFVDYDWSSPPSRPNANNGKFEHTTTFDNITIKVTKE